VEGYCQQPSGTCVAIVFLISLFNMSMQVVQSRPWHWQLVQDYTVDIRAPDTTVVNRVDQNQPTPTPLQIMRKCYDWEAQNPTKRISCFNTNGQLVVGSIVPQRNNRDIDIYVRVLLDDDWRFFSRRRPRSNGPLRLTDELDMDTNPRSPLEAVQAAMRMTNNVRAFNFKGDCTSNAAGLSEANLRFDSGAVFPYEGVWIRNA